MAEERSRSSINRGDDEEQIEEIESEDQDPECIKQDLSSHGFLLNQDFGLKNIPSASDGPNRDKWRRRGY
jgi:hypothetical protein